MEKRYTHCGRRKYAIMVPSTSFSHELFGSFALGVVLSSLSRSHKKYEWACMRAGPENKGWGGGVKFGVVSHRHSHMKEYTDTSIHKQARFTHTHRYKRVFV